MHDPFFLRLFERAFYKLVFHGAKRGAWSALMTLPEVTSFGQSQCDGCNTGARYGEVYEEARRLCHGGGSTWESSQVRKKQK